MNRRFGLRSGAIRLLAASLCVLCAALPLFARGALAEGRRTLLNIQMTARPEELVEPGDVTLVFTIENNSDADAQNVYLSSADGLLSEPIGQIAAGEVQVFNRTHSVTAAELDAGEILYTVSHDDPLEPGGKVNYTAQAQIHRSALRPEAEFTRQFSSESVAAGSSLTIVYRIRNTGNVALTNLRVQDDLGDFTGRVDRLDVGESRALVSRATVTETCASSASLSYGAEGAGDEIFVNILEDVAISLAECGLTHSFSAVERAGNVADVALTLRNVGNVDYRDVCVTDAVNGGVIADALVVPAGGDAVEVRRACPIRGSGGFRWRVTGMSAAGERIDFTTELVALSPAPEGEAAPLRVSAEALTPRIRRAGNVTLRVRIENPGGVDVQDVALSEAGLGSLRSFSILPAGDAIERDVRAYVDADAQFSFTVSYADARGQLQSITTAPVEVVIAQDGVLPEGAKNRFFDFSGNSIKIGGSSTFAALFIAGCVALLALIIMLIIASRRARLEKQMHIAAEKQRRKEEMGKTNRFTPVRAATKKKGKGRNG